MRRILVALLLGICLVACKQTEILDSQWLEENYSKCEVMIPMRDGVGLYTSILARTFH